MSLALSVFVLFILRMQWVNGTQLLNTTSLLKLFGFTAGDGTGMTDIGHTL